MVKTEYDKNAQSVTKEESLSFEIDKQSLVVYYQNISQIKISYYIIDLEVLFSRSPFLKQESKEFSYVEPNFFEYKDLVKQPMLEKIVIPVPPQYAKHNLYIQLTGPNKTQSATYFSSSLKVHVLENYGQIKVTDEHNAPLSKIYVKCYSMDARSSEANFYRDGRTHLLQPLGQEPSFSRRKLKPRSHAHELPSCIGCPALAALHSPADSFRGPRAQRRCSACLLHPLPLLKSPGHPAAEPDAFWRVRYPPPLLGFTATNFLPFLNNPRNRCACHRLH